MKKSGGCLSWSVALAVEETKGEEDVVEGKASVLKVEDERQCGKER
jgi:hypothetical protein